MSIVYQGQWTLKETSQLIKDLLEKVEAQANLQKFFFLGSNDKSLIKALSQGSDTRSFTKWVTDLGKDHELDFNVQDVENVIKQREWESLDEKTLVNKFKANGGIKELLLELNKDGDYRDNFQEWLKEEKISTAKELANFLVKLPAEFKMHYSSGSLYANTYLITLEEAEYAVREIKFEEDSNFEQATSRFIYRRIGRIWC